MGTGPVVLRCALAGLLLPAAALAQDAPWQVGADAATAPPPAAIASPAAPPPAPPPAPLVDPEPAPRMPDPSAARYDPAPGTRYALEALGGLGGLGAGALVALGGVGLLSGSSSGSIGDALLVVGLASGVALFGIPLGVTLVGNGRGGNGGYGWSLLGMIAGSVGVQLVSLPLLTSCSGTCSGTSVLVSVIGLGGMLTGAVLGYELSNDQRALRAPVARPATRWAPTAWATPGGLGAGVAGVF
jgi:hypothetical protein